MAMASFAHVKWNVGVFHMHIQAIPNVLALFQLFRRFSISFPNFTLQIYVIQLTIRCWPFGLARTPSLRFNAVFVHVMHLYV